MKPTLSNNAVQGAPADLQAHLAEVNDPKSLRNQVSAADGSITIISFAGCSIVLNWSFASTNVNINVQLQTPVGSITLINADLDASNPSITFGGSLAGFTAEGTVSFDINALSLTASGKVCAPFFGCKSGSVTINV